MEAMPTDRTPIGIKIKRARERLRITQEELAGLVGVSQKTIDNWEHDRSYPRSAIGALEQALGPLTDEPQAGASTPREAGPQLQVIEGEGLDTELALFKAATDRGEQPDAPPGGIRNDQERDIWNARTFSPWERWEVIDFLRRKERDRTARVKELQAEMEAERRQSGPQH